MSNPVIEAEHLSRWYGHVIGLNEVNVAIQPGVTGLLGPNGAGKSTLLNLVMGLIRPSQGTISVFGEGPWGNMALRERLGYCPEADAFYRFMSGREFVTRMAQLHGLSKREAGDRAEATLVQLGLEDALDRPIAGYSKGMRQRTKLAQAMVHDPDLLILDEPLVGTDPIGRRLMIDLVRQRGREGRSVLVSSHVLHEVEAMTDRILLVSQGRLRASGSIQEIRELLQDHPHTLRIDIDRPRQLARALLQLEQVRSAEVLDEPPGLRLRVLSPHEFFPSLGQLFLEQDLVPDEMVIEDEGLGAVFQYLTGRRH